MGKLMFWNRKPDQLAEAIKRTADRAKEQQRRVDEALDDLLNATIEVKSKAGNKTDG